MNQHTTIIPDATILAAFWRNGRKCFVPLSRDELRRALRCSEDEMTSRAMSLAARGFLKGRAAADHKCPTYQLTPYGEQEARGCLAAAAIVASGANTHEIAPPRRHGVVTGGAGRKARENAAGGAL